MTGVSALAKDAVILVPVRGSLSRLLYGASLRVSEAAHAKTSKLVVKEVFRRAAAALEAVDLAGAATLRRASTHWLRHTSATHQADAGNDIRFIQKNLRHASIETTIFAC